MMLKKGILILLLAVVFIRPSHAAVLWCGKDLNGDGTATDPGETARCVGDNGALCPIDAQSCTSATTNPLCPSGWSFVAANDRCEAPTLVTCSSTGLNFGTMQACTASCSETAACTTNAVALWNSVFNDDYAASMTASGGSFDFNAYNYDFGWDGNNSVYLSGFSAWGGTWATYSPVMSVTGDGNILWVSGYDDNWNYYTTPIYLYGATASGSWSQQACGTDRVVGSGNGLFFYEHIGDCYIFNREAMTGAIYFQGTDSCPYGNEYGCDGGICTRAGACNPGPCPSGYTWNGSVCAASPQCSKGTYNSSDKLCHDGSYKCSYGDSFACVNNGGIMRCSPTTCFDPNASGNQIIQNNDSSMLQNDGQRDDQGNCLGSLYIFSGRSMECRTSGQETGWKNCCLSGDAPLADDVGSVASVGTAVSTITNVYHMGQIAYYGNMIVSGATVDVSSFTPAVQGALTTVGETGSIMDGLTTYAEAAFLNPTTLAIAAAMYLVEDFLLSGSCDQDDVETAMLNNSGMCHYIHSYCKKKWPLVGCVQEAEVFCCFNSKLARIIQEQGRPQLKSFNPNPWGVASDDGPANADCRGFTSTEFQMLDFSKMDLSEYLGDITTQVQSAIQQNVSGKINSYYNSIQK